MALTILLWPEKKIYTVFNTKMKVRHLPLDKIIDVYGIRVLVDTPQECYQVLGLVHELYKPIMGKFKDILQYQGSMVINQYTPACWAQMAPQLRCKSEPGT